MLGQVGLYSDVIYAYQRPDSKRSQALKSRVARAKRCGCGSAATERLARVQFMLGRVGLYIDVTYSLYRRLAKLQFMVWQVVLHCAAASGSRTAAGLHGRSGVEAAQPPGSGRVGAGIHWLQGL